MLSWLCYPLILCHLRLHSSAAYSWPAQVRLKHPIARSLNHLAASRMFSRARLPLEISTQADSLWRMHLKARCPNRCPLQPASDLYPLLEDLISCSLPLYEPSYPCLHCQSPKAHLKAPIRMLLLAFVALLTLLQPRLRRASLPASFPWASSPLASLPWPAFGWSSPVEERVRAPAHSRHHVNKDSYSIAVMIHKHASVLHVQMHR